MTYTTVGSQLWDEVGDRRTPDRWVVVVALLGAALLVGAAIVVHQRGLTAPAIWTSGATGSWDKATSTTTYQLRLSNRAATDVTVTSARFLGADGRPVPGVLAAELTPVVVPGLTIPGAVDGPEVITTLRVTIDCPAMLVLPESMQQPVLVVDTTGTWPEHTAVLGDVLDPGTGFCTGA